jgi:hypothetical protein
MRHKEFYNLNGKEINILEKSWDFLIILDACRFDIFNQCYKEFFPEAKVKKAISPACWTREWAIKTFTSKYNDIIYISGNPNINSYMKMTDGGFLFDSNKHFSKVVDVWDFGWDDALGTIHPIKINKSFHKWYLKYPRKRFILHYNQPHGPWISIGGEPKSINEVKKNIKIVNVNNKSIYSFPRKILRKLPPVFWWEIRKILHINPKSQEEEYYKNHGNEGMKEAYLNNLKLALKHVQILTESISGNWLITSDHGELLGENGWYGHPRNSKNKLQRIVPFMELKT